MEMAQKICTLLFHTTSVDASFLIVRCNSARSCSRPINSSRAQITPRDKIIFPNRPSYPSTCVTRTQTAISRTCNRSRQNSSKRSSIRRRRDASLTPLNSEKVMPINLNRLPPKDSPTDSLSLTIRGTSTKKKNLVEKY